MNRLILLLLALLTGVVAQVSPVQAAIRGAGEAEVGAVQVARGVVQLAHRGSAQTPPGRTVSTRVRWNEGEPLRQFRLAPTAVRIGIDRTRQ